MDTDLSHLPERHRIELRHVVDILLDELETMKQNATQPWKKRGHIVKIILFGSFARNSWVKDKLSGYRSDYDILAVVNCDRMADHRQISMPVQLIVEPLGEVNAKLAEGRYFYTDLQKEGIELYTKPGAKLATPQPKSAEEWRKMAGEYYEKWMESARIGYETFSRTKDLPLGAVFMLHQATERAYCCLLLTTTLYSPATHNIEKLRGLAEGREPGLIEAWPREKRRYRRMFQLLKRAYVEARYSMKYRISEEELDWLGARVKHLIELVDRICRDRLAK